MSAKPPESQPELQSGVIQKPEDKAPESEGIYDDWNDVNEAVELPGGTRSEVAPKSDDKKELTPDDQNFDVDTGLYDVEKLRENLEKTTLTDEERAKREQLASKRIDEEWDEMTSVDIMDLGENKADMLREAAREKEDAPVVELAADSVKGAIEELGDKYFEAHTNRKEVLSTTTLIKSLVEWRKAHPDVLFPEGSTEKVLESMLKIFRDSWIRQMMAVEGDGVIKNTELEAAYKETIKGLNDAVSLADVARGRQMAERALKMKGPQEPRPYDDIDLLLEDPDEKPS